MISVNLKLVILAIVLVLAIALVNVGCSVQKILKDQKKFYQQNVEKNDALTQYFVGNVFAVSAGDTNKPALVYIHGTPGSWKDASRYLVNETLLDTFQVISVDRPGWGLSRNSKQEFETSFRYQASEIAPLLKSIKNHNKNAPVILVGHSLGASLAPQIAADFPQLVDGLLLVSGGFSPELMAPRWYHWLSTSGLVLSLIGPDLASANLEMMALPENLELLAPRWSELNIPISVVQGKNDGLVPPANALYIAPLAPEAELEVFQLEGIGHFVPFTHPEIVIDHINRLYARVVTHRQDLIH